MVGASVDLLSQPVQPAADRARHRLLFHRGSVRRRGYRPDGGDLDIAQFHPEARSTKAADALKAMVSNTATVLRVVNEQGESRWLELPIDQLVPGDIIRLSAGDMIPADLRILQARDLFVAQASLTGESLPVEKVARSRDPLQQNPLECDTLCFMGTNVVSGSAQAIVFATGGRTWFGQLAGRVSEQESEPNAFQKGISRVSMLLIRFMLVMAPVVLLINGYTKGDWWGGGAIRAVGGGRLDAGDAADDRHFDAGARGGEAVEAKVIVKHLDAIQNFGAMDILCTDKTGTLTQDKIVLENHTDVSGKVCERVLHAAWLNSHYQTGLKNLLDTAVLEGVELDAARGLAERWQKVDEIPFDFERRRMSVVVKEDDAAHQLICKGGAAGDPQRLDPGALQRRYRTAGRHHAAPYSPGDRYPQPAGATGGGGGD